MAATLPYSQYLLKDKASGTLSLAMTASDTSFTLTAGHGAKFPASDFCVRIDDETIYVASRATDSCNGLTRGYNGTTAATHAAQSGVMQATDAALFQRIYDNLAGHTHVKADITDFGHTHPQGDITNLVSDLAGKAATSHTHPSPVLSSANTSDVTANAADTYLTGSNVTIGGRVKAGTTIRWRLIFTKTAAGVAAPVFKVRFGTNGTTADVARLTFTGVAQTAAADTATADLEVIVRAVSASATIHGGINFEHFNTTTGFANKAQAQILRNTSAAFDNTAAGLIVGISVNPGSAGVWTFQHVTVLASNLN